MIKQNLIETKGNSINELGTGIAGYIKWLSDVSVMAAITKEGIALLHPTQPNQTINDYSTHVHGDSNKVISGEAKIKNSFKSNEESQESKVVAKQSMIWTKRNAYIAIIAIVVGIVIYLINR